LLVFPASTNYQLSEWAIGGGGTDRSQSTNYQTQTITDPTVGEQAASTNYQIGPGLPFVEMANVPPAPALTNPSNYYNKLHLVINQGSNPSDTKFAVAISTDNFLTTYYVKADNTVGASLVSADWRTYAGWGSGSGINILGLTADTTYYVKVKAEQGDFTESGWGPLSSEATADVELTFDIDTAATDTETAAPYTIALGELTINTITTGTDKVWTDFATNADGGGVVYVVGLNNGLKSTTTNYTIPGVSADLSGETEGFGLKTASITQTSGGPFTADAPFNGASENVGATGLTLIPLATSTAPLVGGRNSVDIKALIEAVTPGATDYTETLTLVAAATF
jgi:hypothetical protein